jgi:hypothetical protein
MASAASPYSGIRGQRPVVGRIQSLNTFERNLFNDLPQFSVASECSSDFLAFLNDEQVTDYLKKKGFVKTEAIFRKETQNLGPDGRPVYPSDDPGPKKYLKAFLLLRDWVDNSIDIYKASCALLETRRPEVANLLRSLSCESFSGQYLSTRTWS